MHLLGGIQLLILGLAGWTLKTTLNTKERVIRLETKVFDSMVAQVKDHSERIRELEHGLDR